MRFKGHASFKLLINASTVLLSSVFCTRVIVGLATVCFYRIHTACALADISCPTERPFLCVNKTVTKHHSFLLNSKVFSNT